MERLVAKYAAKLEAAGLTPPGAALVAGLDADLVWNRTDPACAELEKLFAGLNINALILAPLNEPYQTMVSALAAEGAEAIHPRDSETRTMLHDLPIVRSLTAAELLPALKRRKGAIVPGHGVVAWGTVGPEQAFVHASSIAFACFVKFLDDALQGGGRGSGKSAAALVRDHLPELPEEPPALMCAPFSSAADCLAAVSEAGRWTVDYRLVDSFFGNVSCFHDGVLYISQTAAPLDELEGCVDACPLDGSSCAGITASSELTAHREIVTRGEVRTILHGHPRFAVVMSMQCDRADCPDRERCHTRCPHARRVAGVPIVPGEVGTGPYGLCHTLPPAVAGERGALVYGHGFFAVGREDFNEPFACLLEVERECRRLCLEALGG